MRSIISRTVLSWELPDFRSMLRHESEPRQGHLTTADTLFRNKWGTIPSCRARYKRAPRPEYNSYFCARPYVRR